MEAVGAAVGTIATLYSIIKGIFKLQVKVVKYKEDVDEFVSFIKTTETLLLRGESILTGYQQGHGTLPEDVANSLGRLEIYLRQSRDLLQKLTFYSPITGAPNQMKILRQQIQDVKLNMVCAMVFHTGGQQRVQQQGAQAFQQAPVQLATMYHDQDGEVNISKLMEWGFERESVTQALQLCDGNKEQAAIFLLDRSAGDGEVNISKLMELGFERESVTQALQLCDGNKEQAAIFLLDRSAGNGEVDISRLMELGYERESVAQALQLCHGNKEQAAMYLFELEASSSAPESSEAGLDPASSHHQGMYPTSSRRSPPYQVQPPRPEFEPSAPQFEDLYYGWHHMRD